MDCSLPGSSVHGIFQARVLEWGAIAFSGCWYRQAQLHHKWYVYSSPDHFLTFCPRSQCNVLFFFFFKPECLSQGTAISSKSCFGSEGLRTQPLAHPPLPWNPGLRTIRLELMLSCSVFWSCPVSGLQTFSLPEETSSSLSSESLGLQGNQTGQS